jgi:hypothetical protein
MTRSELSWVLSNFRGAGHPIEGEYGAGYCTKRVCQLAFRDVNKAVCYFIIALMSVSTILRISCNAKVLNHMMFLTERGLSHQKLTPLQQTSTLDDHCVAKYQKAKRRFGDEVEKHMKIASEISHLPRVFFEGSLSIKTSILSERSLSPPEPPPC